MAKLWEKVRQLVNRYREKQDDDSLLSAYTRYGTKQVPNQDGLPLQHAYTRPVFPPILCTGEQPSPRSGHISLCDQEGIYMYVFGGYHDNHCLNDLYRLHLSTQTWKKLDCTGYLPTTRVSHAGIIHKHQLFVFGGSDVPFGQTNNNDLYICDLQQLSWSMASTIGNTPTPRYGHTLVQHNDYIYLFGGTSGCHYFNDFYRLDLQTMCWSLIFNINDSSSDISMTPAPASAGVISTPPPMNLNFCPQSESKSTALAELLSLPETHVHFERPTARYRHEAVVDGEFMYIIGGGVPNTLWAPIDVYLYHFETNTWAWRRCTPSEEKGRGEYPIARRSHSSILYEGMVYVFGGTDGIQMFDDFWCLNLNTWQWKRLDLGRCQSMGKCFHTAVVSPSGHMYMFGGCNDSYGNIRTNKVSMCYLKLPTLLEICLRAIGRYQMHTSHQLEKIGVPDHLLSILTE